MDHTWAARSLSTGISRPPVSDGDLLDRLPPQDFTTEYPRGGTGHVVFAFPIFGAVRSYSVVPGVHKETSSILADQ